MPQEDGLILARILNKVMLCLILLIGRYGFFYVLAQSGRGVFLGVHNEKK